MKRLFNLLFSVLICFSILGTVCPAKSFADNDHRGEMYTDNSNLSDELDAIFDGTLNLFYDNGCTNEVSACMISASLEEKIAFFSSDLDRITVSLATSSHSGSLTYLRDLVNFVSYAIFPNNLSGKHHAILAEVYVNLNIDLQIILLAVRMIGGYLPRHFASSPKRKSLRYRSRPGTLPGRGQN